MVSIGYARVSTEEQTTEGQIEALYNAGCSHVFTENASGGDPRRPILAQAIASLKRGTPWWLFGSTGWPAPSFISWR